MEQAAVPGHPHGEGGDKKAERLMSPDCKALTWRGCARSEEAISLTDPFITPFSLLEPHPILNSQDMMAYEEAVVDGQGATDIPGVYDARSISEIRAALAELRRKDATVTTQLDTLLNAQKDLQRSSVG